MKIGRVFYLFIFLIFYCKLAIGISLDSLKSHQLKEVCIEEEKIPSVVYSGVPSHVLSAEKLETFGFHQLSDALRQLNGVLIRDYGGVGGLKTVSVRGLSSQFSGIALDGITLIDCQNGQVDLGRYMLGNTEFISFSNGQTLELGMPARALVTANLINIKTHKPNFEKGSYVNAKASMELGSFGYRRPSLLVESILPGKGRISLFADQLFAEGNYPFSVFYGAQGDSVSSERRSNADVFHQTVDLNVFYTLFSKAQLSIKSNYYESERGLPGAIIYYSRKNSERLWERGFFTQLQYIHPLSKKTYLYIRTKLADNYTHYLDTMVYNLDGRQDNYYQQNEYYVSSVLTSQISTEWKMSFASDYYLNTLSSNLKNNSNPHRNNWMNALSLLYDKPLWKLNASLLSTYIQEYQEGKQVKGFHRWTPFFSLSHLFLEDKNFNCRFFYKESYRIPNFTELYFYQVANPHLTPEKARQLNVGTSYATYLSSLFPFLSFTTDVYYNQLTDKIVAVPSQNLFLWSVYNIGKVQSLGVDMQSSLEWLWEKVFSVELSLNYSYQKSTDRTDPSSKTFGHQIPYVPFHSGSANLSCRKAGYTFGYSSVFSGKRFSAPMNTMSSQLQAYIQHDLTIGKEVVLKKCNLGFSLQIINILNKQFEIIKNFPMEGRSFRGKIYLQINT